MVEGSSGDMAVELTEAINAARRARNHVAAVLECVAHDPSRDDDERQALLGLLPERLAAALRSLHTFSREAVDVYLLAPSAERFADRVVDGIVDDAAHSWQSGGARQRVEATLNQLDEYITNLTRRRERLD
jgi:hypothetical protein